ncbi:glutathione S-transferase family protein [Frigidibacter mobilis]|uniref:Glutathione S-transferase n=1 Tax=Frigidibacter mobilis TaxID=1335048 RepID=A0A159Z0N7_9RHOB|nr:glutathione S-transferase [Frigidibacter mobilis]AMY68482.1 glutathione S-transferase [Frigidibacter mobilis]
MLTIYGIYKSRATRSFWLMNELGIELGTGARHVPVVQKYKLADPLAADAPLNTGSPEFLQISPAGTIPCMEDDGLVLHESLAINLYLARKHGGPLAPADLAEEAQMMNWALYAATGIEAAALDISFTYAEGRQDDPVGHAVVAAAAGKLRRPFAVLEAHLAEGGFMVGGRFTVADINTAECVRYAQAHAPLLAEFPALKGWLEACQARPAFKAMWAARAAE